MDNNWFLTQQNETHINDISGIVDTESFINFIRIAYDTNPMEMVFGTILIMVVSIYVGKKTSSFISKYVKEFILKQFVKRM